MDVIPGYMILYAYKCWNSDEKNTSTFCVTNILDKAFRIFNPLYQRLISAKAPVLILKILRKNFIIKIHTPCQTLIFSIFQNPVK